jgi:NADH-quinone oxidoreductase subunit G
MLKFFLNIMPTLTIDGKEVEVAQGVTILWAAKKLGIEIPHFCYHPSLSISGSCRMCLVEVEKMPKLQTACSTTISDGMVVKTNTERVRKARRMTLEFLLINHPIDCPICDQAGECKLQDYYMEYGLYKSRFKFQKDKKDKRSDIGASILLDRERCVLCTRCVRFCKEVANTEELGVFNRGSRAEIGLFPGKKIENKYAGNIVDICPVGALTSRDFRFKCRVWFLKESKSICPGCSRGCNIFIHYKDNVIYRIKPRENKKVNDVWICDYGRYGYKFVNEDRVLTPYIRKNNKLIPEKWNNVIEEIVTELKGAKDRVGGIISPQLTNEDVYIFNKFFKEVLKSDNIAIMKEKEGYSDNFLIKGDKNPNSRGLADILENLISYEEIFDRVINGVIKVLYICGADPVKIVGDEKFKEIASRTDLVILQISNINETSRFSHIILPSATFAEKDGTFTNFEGRVQRINKAFNPTEESLPDWEIFNILGKRMGYIFKYNNSMDIFNEMVKKVSVYNNLNIDKIGDTGF